MLTNRALALVFLTLSATSSLTTFAQQEAGRPYAPALFRRDELIENDQNDKFQIRSSGIPSNADKPYSPDLYFRRDLEDADQQQQLPTRSMKKRSPSTFFCKRDSECGGSQFCSEGDCLMRLAKRSLCSRDSMCSSGFCGSQGACLERRSTGTSCSDNVNSCQDGLFCSTVDLKCKEKRGIEESCRVDAGCQEGLSCLNFLCKKGLQKRLLTELGGDVNDLINELETKSSNFFGSAQNPSASGTARDPIQFHFRRSNEEKDELEKRLLSELGGDVNSLINDLENQANSFFGAHSPSASGTAQDPIKLSFNKRSIQNDNSPIPSRR